MVTAVLICVCMIQIPASLDKEGKKSGSSSKTQFMPTTVSAAAAAEANPRMKNERKGEMAFPFVWKHTQLAASHILFYFFSFLSGKSNGGEKFLPRPVEKKHGSRIARQVRAV